MCADANTKEFEQMQEQHRLIAFSLVGVLIGAVILYLIATGVL